MFPPPSGLLTCQDRGSRSGRWGVTQDKVRQAKDKDRQAAAPLPSRSFHRINTRWEGGGGSWANRDWHLQGQDGAHIFVFLFPRIVSFCQGWGGG